MKKNNIAKILLATLSFGLMTTSCDVERLPTGSMASEVITGDPNSYLDAMVRGAYAQLKDWSDPMHRLGEYAGDNMMIRGSSTDAFYEFITYSRTPNNYRLQNFWDYGYKAVAQASNTINMVAEGQSEEIDSKLGECYYIRGMMYFYLTRAFSRPYYQAPDKNLGVPIVNGTPEDMENLQLPDRSTVAQCYQQAIGDLRKAEKMLTTNNGPAYASKGAAQAMLSRIYLYMSGTYENPNTQYADSAAYYASEVINSGTYSLLPRNEFMVYNTIVPENNSESIFVVKRVATEFSGYDHYYGIGGMYAVIGGMGWGEMYASAKYIDLLNETGRNDWRPDKKNIVDARANFIEPQYVTDASGNYTEVFRFIKNVYDQSGAQTNYNYVQATLNRNGSQLTCTETIDGKETTYALTPVNEEQEIYSIKYSDGNTYQGVIDYQMSLNRVYPMFYIVKCSREGEDSHLHSPIISRLGEVYLNRAEAYAKLGRYSEALSDLNLIRERSIPGAGYKSLDASNAHQLIDKERQLELAYQAERSFDVYRNGDTLTRHYPGPHNAMEEVSPADYRVTYYIPQTAINSYPSGSTLTQNPTSNAGVILN
ncbi:MAG: RagB/SusD family nutrient uptake outer membrane protein [Parabacteroides sp.]|uniref:RagB/SusD family nutrient uptake outer membrane protein n=1 Tax=Parabacteroides faecalis TaxID=2924040 RepID=A0ABT0C6T7_9BACT|nr:RagB/SusD family nutrient uptake outer membrane protein [Parabacteroides faecalis]MCI7286897.1 RagB/SusD family nutrient uptake outer membrane protein [Parabacteroides sp.]MDY6255656.1 RagB/SusD family nutrient uptake outer membrane protein [Bacteroidales bacterium]MCJ2382291.1 RagB/SusD family nutrient uptake outer membrane protein [Parabacteroides faecalis]MDD6951431.1 RagB/SusD family nutrient uptake outer membrane protein [Parabacteroides sp.]MDD7562002.1 RagB/SusD family nutrient uptak